MKKLKNNNKVLHLFKATTFLYIELKKIYVVTLKKKWYLKENKMKEDYLLMCIYTLYEYFQLINNV